MFNIGRATICALTIALALLASSAATASAQDVVVAGYYTPGVTYYQPIQPVVAYRAPLVSYGYTVPVVAYAPRAVYTPRVAYYAAPMASYYPSTVRTTRYGIFGQPRRSTTYYSGAVLP